MAISNPGTPSWPRLLAQWRLSGLTQAEFCARRGLSLPTFRYHLYKPSPRSGSPGPLAPTATAETTPLFLPVVCSPASQPGPVPPPPRRPWRSSSATDSASPSHRDSIPRPSDASSMP